MQTVRAAAERGGLPRLKVILIQKISIQEIDGTLRICGHTIFETVGIYHLVLPVRLHVKCFILHLPAAAAGKKQKNQEKHTYFLLHSTPPFVYTL